MVRHKALASLDIPFPIGSGQTASQPYVIAHMVQSLELAPLDAVLEIGTGSGFQTAILCEVTASAPAASAGTNVFSMETRVEFHKQAGRILGRLGYRPHLLLGDGALGPRDGRLFQGIILSAAARGIPNALLAHMAEGGRMVLPYEYTHGQQHLVLVVRHGTGFEARRIGAVRFVPMQSAVFDDLAAITRLPSSLPWTWPQP